MLQTLKFLIDVFKETEDQESSELFRKEMQPCRKNASGTEFVLLSMRWKTHKTELNGEKSFHDAPVLPCIFFSTWKF